MRLIALGAGLLLPVAACTSASTANLPVPTLSFIVPDGQTHKWNIWRPDTGKVSNYLTSDTRPRNIFWRPTRNDVYYTVGTRVYRAKWDANAASSEPIADLPANEGTVRWLWVDKRSDGLRVATMRRVSESEIVGAGENLRYRIPGGETVPALQVPDWGVPYVASVLEFSRTGWKLIARRSTRDEAGDTPGISVLDEFREEDGISNERLLDSYTCSSGICREDVPESLRRKASRLLGRAIDADETSITPTTTHRPAIIFATTFGDSVHMTTPLFAVDKGDRIHPLTYQLHTQIGIALNRGLVLVAEEGTGNDPVVFDARTGTEIFSQKGFEATWVPAFRPSAPGADLIIPIPQSNLSELAQKQGVVLFEVRGWQDANGHARLWNGNACYDHCFFDEPTANYRTERTSFWTLP